MIRSIGLAILVTCGLLLAVPTAQDAGKSEGSGVVPEPRLLTNDGGRLSWYHGDRHDLIAFDAITDDKTKNTDLFLISPDGSGRRCVTCNTAIRKGFIGQPSWHPDGEHLVIQVESENSGHRFYNHMGWGIDNDLWIVSRDGKTTEKIWVTPTGSAALHPHFSPDGRTLIFAERVPTGEKLRGLLARSLAPGGENQWTGWRIHQAQFDVSSMKLSDHRTMKPSGEGFYETHGFRDGRIVYSYTQGGQTYVDDVFMVGPDGERPENLTNSATTWDEHGQFSSRGDLAFISSRVDPDLKFPGSRPANLKTELFVRQNGMVRQLSDMNRRKGKRIAVSDFDWDREGRRIAFQVAV